MVLGDGTDRAHALGLLIAGDIDEDPERDQDPALVHQNEGGIEIEMNADELSPDLVQGIETDIAIVIGMIRIVAKWTCIPRRKFNLKS